MVRVSVGTPAEMAQFKTAFKAVMDQPATANARLERYDDDFFASMG